MMNPPLLTEALRVWRSKRATLFSESWLAERKRRKNSLPGQFFTSKVLRVWRSKRAAPSRALSRLFRQSRQRLAEQFALLPDLFELAEIQLFSPGDRVAGGVNILRHPADDFVIVD